MIITINNSKFSNNLNNPKKIKIEGLKKEKKEGHIKN
jgi:hypothetical protein